MGAFKFFSDSNSAEETKKITDFLTGATPNGKLFLEQYKSLKAMGYCGIKNSTDDYQSGLYERTRAKDWRIFQVTVPESKATEAQFNLEYDRIFGND